MICASYGKARDGLGEKARDDKMTKVVPKFGKLRAVEVGWRVRTNPSANLTSDLTFRAGLNSLEKADQTIR